MSVLTTTYGTRSQIDAGNLNPGGVGLPNGQANAMAAVDNHAAGNDGYLVDFTIATSAAPTTGNAITFYLVQAPSNGGVAGTYTDGTTPGGTSVTINNARPVWTVNMASGQTSYSDAFRLPVPDPAPFWTLVVKNGSGVALAGSGNSVSVTPFTYTIA